MPANSRWYLIQAFKG